MNRLRTRVHALDRRRRHRSAARTLLRVLPEPESWLDVGTGYADFPHAAREFFPYTAFDGIDPTARVEYARRAGRVEEAYAGQVTDPHITSLLRARYDVVTLLRHRSPGPPDPGAELRAALAVLRPGGHLLVEVPGARSDDVRAHLEAQGCVIVTPAHDFLDLLAPGRRVIARR